MACMLYLKVKTELPQSWQLRFICASGMFNNYVVKDHCALGSRKR